MGSDYINLLSLPIFYLFDADLTSTLITHSSLLLQLSPIVFITLRIIRIDR